MKKKYLLFIPVFIFSLLIIYSSKLYAGRHLVELSPDGRTLLCTFDYGNGKYTAMLTGFEKTPIGKRIWYHDEQDVSGEGELNVVFYAENGCVILPACLDNYTNTKFCIWKDEKYYSGGLVIRE